MSEISFKRFTGRHFLLLCFWLGMAGASVVVWWRGAEILSYKNTWPDTASFAGAFFAVIKQRFFQLGAGWLCSLTVYSFWLFGIFTCFWSFCLGMGIASFTAEKGFLGLPIFLRSVLPQGIFYLVVPFSVVVLGNFRRFLLVIFLFLFLHLDFSFIYSKFSMPFWGFFY